MPWLDLRVNLLTKRFFFLSIILVASGSLSYGKRNGKPYLMRYKRAF